jgi:SAM-dependent methyltransferase
MAARARRLLDLQAASVWRDLSRLLPAVEGTLVDVGCGAQPYRELLSPRTKYIGLDAADAQKRFGYETPDTIYFEGTKWPLDDGSVDYVLATETLEHVEEPGVFLCEAARVLCAGGSLILTVPFAARWHFIPYDYWRFTPSSLRKLLEEPGFSDVFVYARGNAWTVAVYKQMALVLPLLFPQGKSPAVSLLLRILSILLWLPLAALAFIGQMSLRFEGGDDCLGYTVTARRGER